MENVFLHVDAYLTLFALILKDYDRSDNDFPDFLLFLHDSEWLM